MASVSCAIFGNKCVTSVDVDTKELVWDFKNKIAAKLKGDVPAVKLTLYLAKKNDDWLFDNDPDVQELSKKYVPDKIARLFLKKDLEMKSFSLLGEYFPESIRSADGRIHILVVLPDAFMDTDAVRPPYWLVVDELHLSSRSATLKAFAEHLNDSKFVFVQGPAESGITTFCAQLHNYLAKSCPEMPVAVVSETPGMQPAAWTFLEWFKDHYGCSFDEFCTMTRDRTLLIDNGDVTYKDQKLWSTYLEGAYKKQYTGLRVVLCSGVGGNFFYKCERPPVDISPTHTFGLNPTQSKPGLRLTREEFQEFAEGTIIEMVSDLAWDFSSGHVGVADLLLQFLRNHNCFANRPPGSYTPADVERVLGSDNFVTYVRVTFSRGVLMCKSFRGMANANEIPDNLRVIMVRMMNDVASGKVVLASAATRSPETSQAVALLTEIGILFVAEDSRLQFPSNVHLKIWKDSNERDCMHYMNTDVWHEEFLIAALKRMNAPELKRIVSKYPNIADREHAFFFRLSVAAENVKSPDVGVEPDTVEIDGKEYVDLTIRGKNFTWIWELLVDVNDVVLSKRSAEGAKHHEIHKNCRHVIVDFRPDVVVQPQGPEFLYVSFSGDYAEAKISALSKEVVIVKLSTEVDPRLAPDRKRRFEE